MVGECKTQANNGGEQERHAADGKSRRDTRVMGECKRQANDGGEAGEWWGRARHRRMMGESRRDTQLMGESRRDTQLMGECKRQARARGRHVVG